MSAFNIVIEIKNDLFLVLYDNFKLACMLCSSFACIWNILAGNGDVFSAEIT